jgi:D-lactate dehydrogenase
MKKILFFDADEDLKKFAQNCKIDGVQYIFFDEPFYSINPKKLEKFSDSEIISVFTHSSHIPNEKLDLFKNLKLITTRSTGVNHIDLDYCKKRKISVCNVPNYGAITVAEFAFGLLLSLTRKIPKASFDMRHGNVFLPNYTGIDLNGKTIGVIGTGSIGRHIIQLAQGFGMKVIAYDLYQNPSLTELYTNSLNQLYQKSDVISLNIPSTPENRHFLNKEAFSKMKDGAYFINTSRGGVVDENALLEALQTGKLSGAALDVLRTEPMSENCVLADAPNILVTPHTAWGPLATRKRLVDIVVNTLSDFLQVKR